MREGAGSRHCSGRRHRPPSAERGAAIAAAAGRGGARRACGAVAGLSAQAAHPTTTGAERAGSTAPSASEAPPLPPPADVEMVSAPAEPAGTPTGPDAEATGAAVAGVTVRAAHPATTGAEGAGSSAPPASEAPPLRLPAETKMAGALAEPAGAPVDPRSAGPRRPRKQAWPRACGTCRCRQRQRSSLHLLAGALPQPTPACVPGSWPRLLPRVPPCLAHPTPHKTARVTRCSGCTKVWPDPSESKDAGWFWSIPPKICFGSVFVLNL